MMACPMKILQIESVVPNLIDGLSMKGAFSNLELQDKDAPAGKDDSVNATADSRDIKLKAKKAFNSLKSFL